VTCKELNPMRRYLQFNDLVFDSTDMFSPEGEKTATKVSTHPNSYGNGSYAFFRSPQLFVEEKSLSGTLNISLNRFERSDRKFVKDFIKLNLIKPGRLWAIEGDRILWAFAYVTDYSESYEKYRGMLSVDVDMKLYEGVWHIANKKRTFAVPYSSCNAMDCYGFTDVDDCMDCCDACSTISANQCCSCDCDDLSEDTALCNEVPEDWQECGRSYKLVYNCAAGERVYGRKNWGSKVCKTEPCYSTIAGRFYSRTVLDTEAVTVILDGIFQDPIIRINDREMTVLGDYEGLLKVTEGGEIFFAESECCEWEEIDMSNLQADELGWKIHNGANQILVSGVCCEMACAYVDVDEITF